MSCDFCTKFNFNKVAVIDDTIHLAGGNINFTDYSVKDLSVKLFQFCPICGCSLVYDKLSANKVYTHNIRLATAAVDSNQTKEAYKTSDDEFIITEEALILIKHLRDQTGCSLQLCKNAYKYSIEHNGDYAMMVAYCKAKVFVVNTNIPFDDCVKRYMKDRLE